MNKKNSKINEEPLVSVIITTYKRADFLKRAINSVLNQSYGNIEILVVDDNDPSTTYRKNTEEIMELYKTKSNVKYIKHTSNMNGAVARNTGIKHSKGKYITYLDDDDIYRTNKVMKQVEFLNKNNEFDAVYCGWFKDKKNETPNFDGDLSYEILSGEVLIRTNTIMIKKNVSNLIGNWDEKYFRNQEAAYLLRFFKKGFIIGVVQEVLIDYDTTDRSNAASPKKNEENFWFFLNDHTEFMEEKFTKKQIKKIYCLRMLGVSLGYLKNAHFFHALKLYTHMSLKNPITFNRCLIAYLIKRTKLA